MEEGGEEDGEEGGEEDGLFVYQLKHKVHCACIVRSGQIGYCYFICMYYVLIYCDYSDLRVGRGTRSSTMSIMC